MFPVLAGGFSTVPPGPEVQFSSVLISIFTLLWSISRMFLSCNSEPGPKTTFPVLPPAPGPIKQHPFLSFPKHLATTILASVSVNLTTLDPPYK